MTTSAPRPLPTGLRRQSRATRRRAAPLEQHHVVPHAVQMAVAFADADIAESSLAVEGEAGGIFGHDLGLQGPVPGCFRHADQPFEQGRADPVSMHGFRYIDADLSDPGGASGIGYGRQRRPAVDGAVRCARDEPADIEMSAVPVLPSRRVGRKSGNPGRQTFGIEGAHLFPVVTLHVFDGRTQPHAQSRCWPPVTNSSVPVT